MTQSEGNSGTTAFTFTVTLGAVSGKSVTMKYATASPGSIPATAGVDYTTVVPLAPSPSHRRDYQNGHGAR